MLEAMRLEVGNVADRRKAPRIPVELQLTVHPLHSDGSLDAPISAQCRDVSTGGICFTATEPIKTRYAYVEFGGVLATAGMAALVKLLRSHKPAAPGEFYSYAGPYRVDL
jgi:hypothetical protein